MCDARTLEDMNHFLDRPGALTRRQFGVLSAGAGLAMLMPEAGAAALEVEARDVDVAASFSGGDLNVRKLEIADLAGAKIEASGEVRSLLSAPDGELDANIQAGEADAIVALVAGMFSENETARRLLAAGPLFAPISIRARFAATGDAGGRPRGARASARTPRDLLRHRPTAGIRRRHARTGAVSRAGRISG